MRSLFVPAMAVASLLLAGCTSAPNAPTLILQTSKAPDVYAQCVVPKLEQNALTPTVTQSSRHIRVVVSSKIAADDVLEAYKVSTGGKVFLYERKPLASTFTPSKFELAARECL
ncbi:hypothetical protein [Pseudomonas fluorescens]|uniref:hypothetical protein n=1 Tax=Pseudomonas fluorescens TaxID=294 RepID=UPI001BE94A27|nr:hypothetical protein [Pseudomonas fluorescens]MBT2372562.1 hypothetical protein [Pseudomonas fluorescens]